SYHICLYISFFYFYSYISFITSLFVPPCISFTHFFFFNAPSTTEIYTLSLHDALPISSLPVEVQAWPVDHLDANPEDNIHVHIRFADGSRGEILYLSSASASMSKERIEVFGQGRTAICEDFRTCHFYRGNKHRRERRLFHKKGLRA